MIQIFKRNIFASSHKLFDGTSSSCLFLSRDTLWWVYFLLLSSYTLRLNSFYTCQIIILKLISTFINWHMKGKQVVRMECNILYSIPCLYYLLHLLHIFNIHRRVHVYITYKCTASKSNLDNGVGKLKMLKDNANWQTWQILSKRWQTTSTYTIENFLSAHFLSRFLFPKIFPYTLLPSHQNFN